MKFKRYIAILCLLCFSVVAFQKPKQANAEVITLTTGTILACAALATSVGYIITNSDMIEDVGRKVYDSIKDIPGAIEQFENKVKVKLAVGVLDAIINACNSLPKETVQMDKVLSEIEGGKEYYGTRSLSLYDAGFTGSSATFTMTSTFDEDVLWKISYLAKSKEFTLKAGESIKVSYDVTAPTIGKFNVGDNSFELDCGYAYSQLIQKISVIRISSVYSTGSYIISGITNYGSVDIPYTEENGKNVSADVSKEYFPTGSGSISVPMDKPLTGYNPSISAPITKPTDLSIDGDIVIDSDTVTDDTVTDDTTGDNVGDNVGDNTGIWDWLKSLINSIIDLLKSIVDFLSNMITSLLQGLKDLFLSLFVPSDTYFVDKFNSIKGMLSDKLNYDSYIKIFKDDYTGSSIKDLTVNIFGQEVVIVKFTMYEHFRKLVDTLIYAFFFFLLCVYNYSQVYKLIRGSDYVSASSTITHMGGGLTQKDIKKLGKGG